MRVGVFRVGPAHDKEAEAEAEAETEAAEAHSVCLRM